MLTIATTAATPMMMPSAVKIERKVLRRNARSAMRKVSVVGIMLPYLRRVARRE